MITQNGRDFTFNTALFSVSSDDEIADLPTTTKCSTVGNETFDTVAAGSYAYLTDGSGRKFVLDGDSDEWKEEA